MGQEKLSSREIFSRGKKMEMPAVGEVTVLGRTIELIGFDPDRIAWVDLTGLPADLLPGLIPGFTHRQSYTPGGIVGLAVESVPTIGFFQGFYRVKGNRYPALTIVSLVTDNSVVLSRRNKRSVLVCSDNAAPGYDLLGKPGKTIRLEQTEGQVTVSLV